MSPLFQKKPRKPDDLSKNSLTIREGTVSELHTSIKWDKSAFKIKDERSTNGTFVNGKRIDRITPLKDGDKIKLGKFVLKFGVKKIREKKEQTPVKKAARKPAGKRPPRKLFPLNTLIH